MTETDSRIAGRAAATIFDAFLRFQGDFEAITRRARLRFEQRDWRGMQADAVARLDLYPRAVQITLGEIRCFLEDAPASTDLWREIRKDYSSRVRGRRNEELARTFYNSITRKVFSTVGVNPDVEYFSVAPPELGEPARGVYRRYGRPADLLTLLGQVLDDHRLTATWRDREADVAAAARDIDARLAGLGVDRVDRVEVLRPIFFRNKGAYIIGRLGAGDATLPLVIALVHGDDGITIDAVLTDEALVSILFSFTWSYFHVESQRPQDLVSFLSAILPVKPVAELYVSLGFNKHGKTELYRDLRAHLERGTDRFRIAPGARGLVMVAFTLTDYDVVFKVIKDRFGTPKHTSRREVMAQYHLVFKRDRVGRLVDAQEFEHLEFEKRLFAPELLDELLAEAGRTVRVEGEQVVIGHLYTERRVTPLDLYIRQEDTEAVHRAVLDYGNAIKELAKANIFPGDFVLKNFGVTRHDRVVFYDYDELCLLTDCRFRRLPAARFPEEELEAEPWFRVDAGDIFPEEFGAFVELRDDLREVFLRRHADLFTVEFWRDLQDRNRRGEIMEFFPYPESRRLGSGD